MLVCFGSCHPAGQGPRAVAPVAQMSWLTRAGSMLSPGHAGPTVRRLSFLQVALDGDLCKFRQLLLGGDGGAPHAAPG